MLDGRVRIAGLSFFVLHGGSDIVIIHSPHIGQMSTDRMSLVQSAHLKSIPMAESVDVEFNRHEACQHL